MRWLRAAALAASLGALGAQAALPVVRGEPAATPKAVPGARLRLPAAADALRLPPVSEHEIGRVREANARAALKTRRVVIGVERAASLPAVRMPWRAVEGGHATQVAVTSPDAGSMRLGLQLAGVPDDVEMVFFGSSLPARLEGPVRAGDIRDRMQTWWSPLTEGETQAVEFFVPGRHDPRALPLALAGASHVFTTPSSGFTKRVQEIGHSGACNVDIACSALGGSGAFRDVAASVAQMVFNENGLTGLCTGSLLNDADPSSQVPWFYSANHCFENSSAPYKSATEMQAVANTLTTLWRFEASACRSATPDASWSQLGGGATFVFNDAAKDVLFLRLNQSPPSGAFFSGWDANPLGDGAAVLTVHHPQGDLKKVSEGRTLGFSTPGVAGAGEPFIEVRWSSGTTEPGSSGSGLWTAGENGYVFRGGLWGGDALCTNPGGTDNFSRFDRVYGSLAAYLSAGGGAIDYSDLWFNPDEPGWGLNLIQHAGTRTIFGVWYTYEADGTQTWFVMPSGSWTSSTTYSGPVYATSGPAFSSGAFEAKAVRRSEVGSATLSFSDAGNGIFTYTVNGVPGSRRIARQPY